MWCPFWLQFCYQHSYLIASFCQSKTLSVGQEHDIRPSSSPDPVLVSLFLVPPTHPLRGNFRFPSGLAWVLWCVLWHLRWDRRCPSPRGDYFRRLEQVPFYVGIRPCCNISHVATSLKESSVSALMKHLIDKNSTSVVVFCKSVADINEKPLILEDDLTLWKVSLTGHRSLSLGWAFSLRWPKYGIPKEFRGTDYRNECIRTGSLSRILTAGQSVKQSP